MKRLVPPKTSDPAEVERFHRKLCDIVNDLATAASTASTLDELKADLNALLTKLRGE